MLYILTWTKLPNHSEKNSTNQRCHKLQIRICNSNLGNCSLGKIFIKLQKPHSLIKAGFRRRCNMSVLSMTRLHDCASYPFPCLPRLVKFCQGLTQARLVQGLSGQRDQKILADLDIVPDNNNTMKALSKKLSQSIPKPTNTYFADNEDSAHLCSPITSFSFRTKKQEVLCYP